MLNAGVQFRFATQVTGLLENGAGRISAFAGFELLKADHIVVDAGIASVGLLRPLGIGIPFCSLKVTA